MIYSDNKNQQILIALLKIHNIHTVITSPGGTNPAMVISLQSDPFFKLYSCVDERSAAYMACGLAEEKEEPVALCCTGATASRNYMSALTEAFYRKIPILAITCSRPNYNIGHLMPQVTNRNVYPADVVVDGVHLQVIKDENDFSDVEYKVNRALLALRHRGGGPVHINVETTTQSCSVTELPNVHPTFRICQNDRFPSLPQGSIAIFIGSHKKINNNLQHLIESFCETHNAVVLKDHTSGYYGKYAIHYSLLGTQLHNYNFSRFSLLIHIGEMSGDYLTFEKVSGSHVWRINEDGVLRIRFHHLDYIFEMPEEVFFNQYVGTNNSKNVELYLSLKKTYDAIYEKIPDLPLSHIYIAYTISKIVPNNCVIHFAILNALRSWNFFELDNSIRTYCNVGGFGIDGCMSTLIGASLANPDKLYYLITGDLSFFYDMNSLGNRHIGSNVRILLVNDGRGAEFCHYMFPKYPENTNLFVAGAGHYGNQSEELVKHYSQDLGFEYYQAKTKEEFMNKYQSFLSPNKSSKPILFEIITSTQNQSDSWRLINNIEGRSPAEEMKHVVNVGINRLGNIIKK